ncbi:MAG: hypothetical protein NVSMB19_25320 [Vulcanimicrobiaceae bacterium]
MIGARTASASASIAIAKTEIPEGGTGFDLGLAAGGVGFDAATVGVGGIFTF